MSEIPCQKLKIQMIIDPGTYYAVEYEEGEAETDSDLSQRDVKPFNHIREIYIAQIVAVKYENKFYRGLITDIFKRFMRPVYCAWLIDKDKNVEVFADSIYMIKSPELRNKKLSVFEIILYRIRPATIELKLRSVDLDGDPYSDNFNGILHKRECDTWSPAAIEFVKDLFKSNKCIYVKYVGIVKSKIFADIYYKEGNYSLKSLAKTLCDKNFAVFSRSRIKVPAVDKYTGGEYLNIIEKRIPKNIPKNKNWEESIIMSSEESKPTNNSISNNLSGCSASDKSISDQEKRLNSSKDAASPLGTKSYSPSENLKKMDINSPSTSSESFASNSQSTEETEGTEPKPVKINLLRIILKSVELHDKSCRTPIKPITGEPNDDYKI